jgi:cysteine-rich repeat protein
MPFYAAFPVSGGVQRNICGNGIIENSKECDDGNTTPGDGCDENCQIESICGDGIVTSPPEVCDDGKGFPANRLRKKVVLLSGA